MNLLLYMKDIKTCMHKRLPMQVHRQSLDYFLYHPTKKMTQKSLSSELRLPSLPRCCQKWLLTPTVDQYSFFIIHNLNAYSLGHRILYLKTLKKATAVVPQPFFNNYQLFKCIYSPIPKARFPIPAYRCGTMLLCSIQHKRFWLDRRSSHWIRSD